ncbi:MAG: cobalamin-binding protein [Flavobacterium sp.]|nr:cobalamin-binding protein [Pedobacter sp.]
MTDKKIISLLPSATEIVCALGLTENLVGISHECDYPENIKELPVCSLSKVHSSTPSGEIDKKVKQLLSQALSIYDLDTKLISGLNPDVIITQTQCDVCAVSFTDVERALSMFLDKNAEVISLESSSLKDILIGIRQVAAKLEVADRGEILIENLEERVNIIKHKLKFFDTKPSVACIEWMDPLMIAGNWIPELVDIAGGNSILTQNNEHSIFIEFEKICIANPEIIILMPCGFSIERTLKEMQLLLQLSGWSQLSAVKNNKIFIADGNQYFNRPGPRIVDSIEILSEIIHPKQFKFGYEGSGWIQFNI